MMLFPGKKARKIQLLILDVDGILTSGRLFYAANGEVSVGFHVHDGLGMKQLQQNGMEVAIITARQSDAVAKRMQDLGIQHVFQGQHDKEIAFNKIKQQLQLEDSQIAYMGDDLPDLPLLKRAGLSVTVKNAPKMIRREVDWITRAPGGEGAVRELCDRILQAKGGF